MIGMSPAVLHNRPGAGGDERRPRGPTMPPPPLTPAETPPKAAPSQVTAVTVYQGNALVTRLVDVPDGKGLVEVVVTPLPPSTVDSSLYAEGTDGLRVLSSRYRDAGGQGRYSQGGACQGGRDPYTQARGRAAQE